VVVLGLDLYNGNANQVNGFTNGTGATFPVLMYASSQALTYGAGTSDFYVIGIDGVVKYLSRWYDEGELQSHLDTLTSTPEERPRVFPMTFNLEQNFPNPFNPSTSIRYELRTERKLDVTLTIYNLLGVHVRTLVSEQQGSGFHEVTWDGRDDSNIKALGGAYFYTLQAGEFTQTRRMILLP